MSFTISINTATQKDALTELINYTNKTTLSSDDYTIIDYGYGLLDNNRNIIVNFIKSNLSLNLQYTALDIKNITKDHDKLVAFMEVYHKYVNSKGLILSEEITAEVIETELVKALNVLLTGYLHFFELNEDGTIKASMMDLGNKILLKCESVVFDMLRIDYPSVTADISKLILEGFTLEQYSEG